LGLVGGRGVGEKRVEKINPFALKNIGILLILLKREK
jgi:hypothetical protein